MENNIYTHSSQGNTNKRIPVRMILKKTAAVSMVFLLVFFCACSKNITNSTESDSENASQVQADEEDAQTFYTKVGSYANERTADCLSSTKINFSESSYQNFVSGMEEYEISFPLEELYNYEEATEYFSVGRADVTEHTYSGFIVDGKINEEKLLESVKENSPIFRTEGKHYLYTLIEDDDELALIISYVAEALNECISDKNDEALAVLDCVLGELTIFYGGGSASAEVTDENALLVNDSMIEAAKITTGKENAYRDIIYHEAIHLAQVDCIDYEGSEYKQQGISRSTENLEVNTYQWLWATEGAAEKGSMNLTGAEPTFYPYLVGYIETLDLVCITSAVSTTGADVETTTVSRDIEKFYELITLDRGMSQEDIVKMMYAMEIMQARVEDFPEQYEAYTGEELGDDEYTAIKQEIRRQFLLSATQIFYTNLADGLVRNDNATLEDVYYLVSLFEADINYHIEYWHNDVLSESEAQDFLQKYSAIQNDFFELLSLDTDMNYDEIINGLNSYAMYAYDENGTIVSNATLAWLTNEQKEWLDMKASSTRVYFANPINLVVSSLR